MIGQINVDNLKMYKTSGSFFSTEEIIPTHLIEYHEKHFTYPYLNRVLERGVCSTSANQIPSLPDGTKGDI